MFDVTTLFDSSKELDFKQGEQGTCAYLSVINHFLQNPQGREYLQDLISHDGQNPTVTFPGREPISVTPEMMTDGVVEENYGVAILDAALVEVQRQDGKMSNPFELIAGSVDTYSVPLNYSEFASQNSLVTELVQAGSEGKMILTASTPVNAVMTDINNIPISVPAYHQYSVLPQQDGTIIIENPHDTSARFHVSMSEFSGAFDTLEAAPMPGSDFLVSETNQNLADLAQNVSSKQYDAWAASGLTSFNSTVTGEAIENSQAASADHNQAVETFGEVARMADFRAAVANIGGNLPPDVLAQVQLEGRTAIGGSTADQGAAVSPAEPLAPPALVTALPVQDRAYGL